MIQNCDDVFLLPSVLPYSHPPNSRKTRFSSLIDLEISKEEDIISDSESEKVRSIETIQQGEVAYAFLKTPTINSSVGFHSPFCNTNNSDKFYLEFPSSGNTSPPHSPDVKDRLPTQNFFGEKFHHSKVPLKYLEAEVNKIAVEVLKEIENKKSNGVQERPSPNNYFSPARIQETISLPPTLQNKILTIDFTGVKDALLSKYESRSKTSTEILISMLKETEFYCPIFNHDMSHIFRYCSVDDLHNITKQMHLYDTQQSSQKSIYDILPKSNTCITHCFIIISGHFKVMTSSSQIVTLREGHILGFESLNSDVSSNEYDPLEE